MVPKYLIVIELKLMKLGKCTILELGHCLTTPLKNASIYV